MGRNEVKKEDGSQERTGAGDDKSSAAASVEFVEKPHKLKHDKPDYYLRGFNSQLELDGFYQALLELGKQKALVRSPAGWANNIIKDINPGGLCEYLNEYRRGEPVGMCEKQEWEIAPGQVYPRFLRFLSCRLPNRNSPPAILLRESYREGSKIHKRTLANLSKLPDAVIDNLKIVLKGGANP